MFILIRTLHPPPSSSAAQAVYNSKKDQEKGTFSGHAWQLGDALKELGYQVPRRLQGLVVVRYGDDEGNISINDFLMATCRISVMLGECPLRVSVGWLTFFLLVLMSVNRKVTIDLIITGRFFSYGTDRLLSLLFLQQQIALMSFMENYRFFSFFMVVMTICLIYKTITFFTVA